MAGTPDPKAGGGAVRIVDPDAGKRILLRFRACAACGHEASNAHHVVQKGSPHFGDDVEENEVPICGTGTVRCHGAIHGTPYTVHVSPGPGSVTRFEPFEERRDAEWVARRIGVHLSRHRRDVIDYVLAKLGAEPGREFLRRFYYLEV